MTGDDLEARIDAAYQIALDAGARAGEANAIARKAWDDYLALRALRPKEDVERLDAARLARARAEGL